MKILIVVMTCLTLSAWSLAQQGGQGGQGGPGGRGGAAQPVGAAQPGTPPNDDAQRGLMRTDALRLLSEADQFFTNGQSELAFERLSRLKREFMSVLDASEQQTVEQQFEQTRSALGLQVLADGRVMPMMKDEDIDGLLMVVPGTYATDPSKATETSPALRYHAARVLIEGVANAIYFEVARADDPANPFRQGIITFLRIGGTVRMRVLDIGEPARREAVVGMWAAPEVFPNIPVGALSINSELVVSRAEDGSAYVGTTEKPQPCMSAGAVQMTSSIRVSSNGLSVTDRGLDGSGGVVWGPTSADDPGTVFRRDAPNVRVTRESGGLVTIDLVGGETGGYQLGVGGQLAVHYSQWTTDGLRLESSRTSGRGPAVVRYPLGSIPGIDQGLKGITKGTRRRVIIPPALAYGAQARPPIPANSTIVFDFEVMWTQAPPEPTPAPEGDAAAPAGPPAGNPQPRPSGPPQR
ncbi:MAG: CpcT/CpeT family chromophore lyase [Phycisphaerales bacterium]